MAARIVDAMTVNAAVQWSSIDYYCVKAGYLQNKLEPEPLNAGSDFTATALAAANIEPASRPGVMSALVLVGRRKSYTFQRSQLQLYPDSLLTNLALTAGDSNNGHAAADSTVAIRLQDMIDSPLEKHEWAADVADSLYRNHHIAPDILSLVVKDVEGKSLHHFKQPFSELVDVLSYLGFTRYISKFLPNVAAIPLSQSKVLAFCFAFQDLQHLHQVTKSAEQAVSSMLDYCPFSTPPADPDTGLPQFVQKPGPNANAVAQGVDTPDLDTGSQPIFNQNVILHRNWHRVTVFAIASDKQDIHAPLTVYRIKGEPLKRIAYAYEQHINSIEMGHMASFQSYCDSLSTDSIIRLSSAVKNLKFVKVLGSCSLGPEQDVEDLDIRQLVGKATGVYITKAFESRIQSCQWADSALLSLCTVTANYLVWTAEGHLLRTDFLPLWIVCY